MSAIKLNVFGLKDFLNEQTDTSVHLFFITSIFTENKDILEETEKISISADNCIEITRTRNKNMKQTDTPQLL